MGIGFGIGLGIAGGAAAVAPFSPSDIPGLQIDLDAASGTLDAGGAPCDDGEAIATWIDAASAVSFSTTGGPLWVASEPALGGAPAADMTGDRINGDTSALSASGDITLYCALDIDVLALNLLLDIRAGATKKLQLELWEGFSNSLQVFDGAAWRDSTYLLPIGPHVVGLKCDSGAGNMRLRVDGADAGVLMTYATTALNANGYTLGGDRSGGQDFNGQIARFLWYNRLLTAGEQTDLEAYLANLIGI